MKKTVFLLTMLLVATRGLASEGKKDNNKSSNNTSKQPLIFFIKLNLHKETNNPLKVYEFYNENGIRYYLEYRSPEK